MKWFFVVSLCIPFYLTAQIPNPALIGYWHNWNDMNAPYIQLDQIDNRYNIIDVSFATPQVGTDYKMEFIPDQVSPSVFISQIQNLQSQGKKVLISIGGANTTISLDNISERDTFIATMNAIISTYGFDGMDIDLEGGSVSVSGGTIANPTDVKINNLIDAIKQIMNNFSTATGKRLILTMAPETAFIQGGMSAYGGIWGAYLPIVDALRDSLEILHVQLYNSGSMYGIDGNIYTQGTADFIIAMTEAVIQGFNTAGGAFAGLPEQKIAVGLPACTSAAGGGYVDTASVAAALRYLTGIGPQPGSYVLFNPNAYPNLRGMMTWSVNWDAVANCNGTYTYAQNFQNLFSTSTDVFESEQSNNIFTLFPNPAGDVLHIKQQHYNTFTNDAIIINHMGMQVKKQTIKADHTTIDISDLSSGVYFIRIGEKDIAFVKQ